MVLYLSDEDFPAPLFRALTSSGADVVRVQDIARGAGDDVVLALGLERERVLLTRDVGFGERVVRRGARTAGIVLVRLRGARGWSDKSARVMEALSALAESAVGAISTVDWTSIRRHEIE